MCYNLVSLTDERPTGFYSYMFWEFISQVQVLKAEVSDVGFKSFVIWGEAPGAEDPLESESPCQVGFMTSLGLSLSYPLQCAFCLFVCPKYKSWSASYFFSEKIFPYIAIDSVCLG